MWTNLGRKIAERNRMWQERPKAWVRALLASDVEQLVAIKLVDHSKDGPGFLLGVLMTDETLLRHAAMIVASYTATHPTTAEEVPALLRTLSRTMKNLQAPETTELTPSVPIQESVFPDHVICLEDGKPFRSLKRHLSEAHDLMPEQYRARWGLPSNYPIVASDYSTRGEIAKKMGLGRRC